MNAYRTIIAVLATTSMLMVSAFTSAATITITDLTDGPPTLTFSGFPSMSPTCDTQNESVVCTTSFSDGVSSDRPFGVREVIGLYEDASFTRLSDFFLIDRIHDNGVETETLQFVSDAEQGLITDLQITIRAVETGAAQLFRARSLCNGCLDITFSLTSDAGPEPEPEPAPAPGTLALLGLGLFGLGWSRRKKA
jgi:hypothetical protein